MEHIEKALWKAGTGVVHFFGFSSIESQKLYGRSKFEGGEVSALRSAFISNAQDGAVRKLKIKTGDILDILKAITGYSEITKKELNYVLDEAGLKEQGEVDLDQFIEVSFSFIYFFLSSQAFVVDAFLVISEDMWQSQRNCANAYTDGKG